MALKIRLDRLLSNLGYGGRKEMAMAIKNGWLEIDGIPVTDPSFGADINAARTGRILFDGEALDPPAPHTVMLHKPSGYTCSHKDPGKIVYDLLPARWASRKPSFSSIGRLDKQSSGQLIFTDDGDLLHRVTHHKSFVTKHYAVSLRDSLRGDEAELFASGDFCMIGDDRPLKPAQWTPDGEKGGVMALNEGRFHQIRRMFETIGNEVITLHRFQTGNLALGDLPEGTWRVLEDKDLALIFEKTV
jgi:16S rRNA pseudouridine516 synthase